VSHAVGRERTIYQAVDVHRLHDPEQHHTNLAEDLEAAHTDAEAEAALTT
jgi:hypothetical protein